MIGQASPINPLSLPFDQYGRYQMMREALDAARPLLGRRLRVLDVGGYYRTLRGDEVLPAQLFLRDDDVTVVDQQPAMLPGYVRGDGRGLAFADKSFDVVISCDTLEHVPAADRPAFWDELLRLARCGVLLAAPFAGPEVNAAEALLFSYIKAELGVEQLQLREHASYGLPDPEATHALLDERGLHYRVYPSGHVHAWLFMMLAKHYLLGRTGLADFDLHEQVDAYYTRFFAMHERREPAYRHLFCVSQTDQPDWLAAVDAALTPTIHASASDLGPGWNQLAGWLLHFVGLSLDERRAQPLAQALATQAQVIATQVQTINSLQEQLAQRDAQIADLERRATWLAEQANTAQHMLEQVARGRVLRLLRWLRREQ